MGSLDVSHLSKHINTCTLNKYDRKDNHDKIDQDMPCFDTFKICLYVSICIQMTRTALTDTQNN